jgi:hypothetical protein
MRALDVAVVQVEHADQHGLRAQRTQHGEIDLWLRGFDRNLVDGGVLELGEERVAAGRLVLDERRIAETQVQRRRAADACQRSVDRLDAVAACAVRASLEPRLVELHDICAGREQVVDLFVHGLGIRERQALVVAVMLVDGLLRHRERTRQRDLDRLRGVGAQKLDVAHLHGPPALDRPRHDRHGNLVAGAPDDLAYSLLVDAVERVREAVRVAFAAYLAIGDDVHAGTLLLANRFERRFVLGLLEALRRHPPNFLDADARRHHLGEQGAIDEPVGLRVAADDRRQ